MRNVLNQNILYHPAEEKETADLKVKSLQQQKNVTRIKVLNYLERDY